MDNRRQMYELEVYETQGGDIGIKNHHGEDGEGAVVFSREQIPAIIRWLIELQAEREA